MTSQRAPFFALLVILLFVAMGCDKCGKGEDTIPETPKARVQAIADHMPSKTEAMVYLSDLKETRKGLNILKERLPGLPVVEQFQTNFQQHFGINLMEQESWSRAGIAPDSTAAFGAYRSRIIFTTYVNNRQQFEKILTDKAKNAFQIQSVTKNETVGGHAMKILSDDPSRQIAWLYKGKLAVVVMPATSVNNALQEGTASLVLADIAGTKKEASLGASVGFKSFQKDLADKYSVAAFLNPLEYMNSEEFKKAMKENPEVETGAAWAKQNLQYAGLGVTVLDAQADVKLHAGMKPEIIKQALEAVKPQHKMDWTGFATENVLLGVRLSVDWPKVWKLLVDNLPDDNRRALLRDLKMQGAAVNLDIENELLGKLTGNVGVFFYGMAGGLSDLMGGAGGGLAEKAGLIIALQFDEPASVDNILTKIMSPLAMMVQVGPMMIDGAEVEGWRMLEFKTPQSPGRIFINENRVILATMALSPQSVLDYASNKRSEKRLKDVEGFDLGTKFAGAEPFNGVYLNANRLRNNLGAMLMAYPQAAFLNEIQEASLVLGAEEAGGYANLKIDLVPKKGTDTVMPEGKPADGKPAPAPAAPKDAKPPAPAEK